MRRPPRGRLAAALGAATAARLAEAVRPTEIPFIVQAQRTKDRAAAAAEAAGGRRRRCSSLHHVPVLPAGDIALALGEWQTPPASVGTVANMSSRASRRGHQSMKAASGNILQDKSGLILPVAAVCMLLGLFAICLASEWAHSREIPGDAPRSSDTARSGRMAADRDARHARAKSVRQSKHEEKPSPAPSPGIWARGLWQWRSSELHGSPAGDTQPPQARPSWGGGSSAAETVEDSPMLKAPLCPLLLVPEGTRLNCVVENDMCRRKQEMAFNIRGVGGAHLFQVRVAELGNATPGIFVETLGGEALLAFLSTEEIWRSVPRPALSIFWPSGVHYGTMQKSEEGDYIIQQNGMVVLVFTGDFVSHTMRVKSGTGRTVASVTQDSPEEYQVVVHKCNDAGLVILGVLAIDKCELEPASRPASSMGTSVSDVGVLLGELRREGSPQRGAG